MGSGGAMLTPINWFSYLGLLFTFVANLVEIDQVVNYNQCLLIINYYLFN